MTHLLIREAEVKDIPFIAEAIINAEKSGTNVLSYTTLFGLSEDETKKILTEILGEETSGCELSLANYLLAEKDGKAAAAVAAWIEGEDCVVSNNLKRNLISCYFPKKSFEKASSLNIIASELLFSRMANSIQIEIVYTAKEFRGQKLAAALINKQIEKYSARKNDQGEKVSMAEVQVFAHNSAAIKLYESLGFCISEIKKTINGEGYFPSSEKYLLRKNLQGEIYGQKRSI
jgi:ribosomal protein S18 acetylase RimI-like enzyme